MTATLTPPTWTVTGEPTMTSESIENLAKALVKAQAAMGKVGKGGENKYDHYSYARLEDFVAATKPHLEANGLAIVTSVISSSPLGIDGVRTTTKGNKENAILLTLEMKLLHESGEWLAVRAVGEGQDRADKGAYKAHTGARKYALASLFALATTDDPEADETVGTDGNSNKKRTTRTRTKPSPSPGTPASNGDPNRIATLEDKSAFMNVHVKGPRAAYEAAEGGVKNKQFAQMLAAQLCGVDDTNLLTCGHLQQMATAIRGKQVNLETGELLTTEEPK